MSRPTRRWLAGALAAAISLSACTSGGEVDPDGVVRVAVSPPGPLLPAATQQPGDLQLLDALFTPLVDFDPQGRPYEVAAASIEPDAHAQVWTITLREGFTFHNGEAVTADNYLAAWHFAAHAANEQRSSYLFARIEGYELVNPPAGQQPSATELTGLARVDDHTFTVTLSEPFRDFRAMLGYAAFYPLPDAAFQSEGQLAPDVGRAPIGNGQFQLTGRDQDTGQISLRRYDGHPDAPSRAGGVDLLPYQDPDAAYQDLLAGRIDVVSQIPAHRLPAAAEELGDRYLRGPAPSFQFLAFPTYQEELAEPTVRRAISMAIDREQVVGGARAVARSFAGPVAPGSRKGTCGEACEFDPAAAGRQYAAADGPDRLRITYNTDGGHADWIELLCDQLRAHLDVECTTSAEPTLTDVLAKVQARDEVGVFRLGWVTDYPTLENYLAPLFATDGSANWHGYSNPEFDSLMAAGRAASSPDEALAAYQAAEDLLARDLPVVPLSFDQHHVGHSERVRNVTVTPSGVDLTQIEVLH